MEDDQSPLDAQIGRLLSMNTAVGSNKLSDERDQADYQRMQSISIDTTSGDTLVRIGFPAGDYIDCNGTKWETKEFLMESQQLLATGSSVFADLLSPQAQEQARHRFNRRLQREPKALPDTEYVLDLTPPIEGDESASLVAKLSLSDGVRDWWRACIIVQVSKYQAGGHDDVCHNHLDALLSVSDTCQTGRHDFKETVDIGRLIYPKSREIPDYCPIRHRAAIIRLLIAIRCKELVLNSAQRMAMVAMVASYYDCRSVVNDSVLSWFISEPNQNFVDINAEDAFRIAWALQIPAVTRAAFRVLVVERALDILDKNTTRNTGKRQTSIFERPRGSLLDEQETCVQHAAQRLAQRAEELWIRLTSSDIHVLLGITRWPFHDPDLCHKLYIYMHGIVVGTWERQMNSYQVKNFDENRARYVSTTSMTPISDIYQDLMPAQRILTSQFWHMFYELADPGRARSIFALMDRPFTFDLEAFQNEFFMAITKLGDQWTSPQLEVNIPKSTPMTLGLSDEEFKFLPLWADGLDDDTGAVYQSEIPDAVRGVPIGPGPSFRTGETIAEDDRSSAFSTDDEGAPTVATGTYTDSVTLGYSVRPTASHTDSIMYEEGVDNVDNGLAAANARLLSSAPIALPLRNRPMTTTTTIQTPEPSSQDSFDWCITYSDEEDLGHLDDFGSDDGSDVTERGDDAANSNSRNDATTDGR